MLWDEPKIFFLERRYFFSIILSEFLKNRVALQQTGRAGRDGGKAHCILLYSSEDFWMASALVEPYENTRLNESLQQMMAYCEDRKHCLKHLMLEALGQAAGKKCRFCTNCQAGRL